MTAMALSSRDRTPLLAGTSIILALIFVSRGIPAWVRWERRVRDDAAVANAEAAASQRAVRSAPVLSQIAQHIERRYLALAPALLTGDDRATAGAALISTVNSAARAAGVQVGALQIEMDTAASAEAAAGIVPIRVRGDGAGDIGGVARFLATIEGNVPLLAVRELTITPTDPHLTNDKPETLRLSFLIEGLEGSDLDRDGQPDNAQGAR